MKRASVYLPLIALVAMLQSGCGRLYLLSEKDLSYVPYKGNETLIFQSGENKMDSMRLGADKYIRAITALPAPAWSLPAHSVLAKWK